MDKISVKLVDIELLRPYKKNAKNHSSAQVEKIAISIREFGWDQPIVVDKNYEIIKGHGRYLAAQLLELKKVPIVIREDLSKAQVKASRIADNKVAESDYDFDILAEEIKGLDLDWLEFDIESDSESSTINIKSKNEAPPPDVLVLDWLQDRRSF